MSKIVSMVADSIGCAILRLSGRGAERLLSIKAASDINEKEGRTKVIVTVITDDVIFEIFMGEIYSNV